MQLTAAEVLKCANNSATAEVLEEVNIRPRPRGSGCVPLMRSAAARPSYEYIDIPYPETNSLILEENSTV